MCREDFRTTTFCMGRFEKIGEKKDKLIYLYRIDPRIDPNLIERIKEDTRLGDVFKSRFTRHPIK